MKSKRLLLLVAFAVILLVTLMVVPAVAFAAPGGSDCGKPVNWVSASFLCSPTDDLPVWSMDVINVRKLHDGTVRGTFLDQSIGKPGEYSYRYSSRSFASEYWDEFQAARGLPSLSHAYFCHGAAYPAWLWPTSAWMDLPSTWATFVNADTADFVAYVPANQLDPAWRPLFPDSMPLRYVLLDFGGPGGGNDRFMAWAFVPADPADPNTFWLWYPMNVPDDPVPFAKGNIQVHVGAPDF
jgi:hypothetical protein